MCMYDAAFKQRTAVVNDSATRRPSVLRKFFVPVFALISHPAVCHLQSSPVMCFNCNTDIKSSYVVRLNDQPIRPNRP